MTAAAATTTTPPPPSLSVTGVPSATAKAKAAGGPATLTWSTGDGTPGDVTMATDAGPQGAIGYGNSGSQPLAMLAPGHRYVVQLHAIGVNKRLLTQATISNGSVVVRAIARTVPPRSTPALIDRGLQIAPYFIALLLLWLTVAYVRSLRAIRV